MAQILTIAAVVFVLGAILLLERRCLGKSAFVQPLVLCLIAGLIIGEEETGLWFGVSLQLLSIGQSHYCNWALAGMITSATLVTLPMFQYNGNPILVEPGHPTSLVLLCSGILYSILAETIGRSVSSKAAKPLKSIPLWQSPESFNEFARLIHRQVAKGFVLGGLQSLVGATVCVLLVYGSYRGDLQIRDSIREAVLVAVPTFGTAVTLGAMSGKRYPLFGGLGIGVFFMMLMVMRWAS